MKSLPEGWGFAGTWQDGDYHEGTHFDNGELASADAIILTWSDGDRTEFITLHGADDIDSVVDQIEDIDTDSYFE